MEINRHTIRSLRKAYKMTQQQFATMLKISYTTLSSWENGHRDPSSLAIQVLQSLYEKINSNGKNI